MPALVVRDMSVEMHRRLKFEARQHHRSMNREVLWLLERSLEIPGVVELPPAVKSLKPISGAVIERIVREMRDQG